MNKIYLSGIVAEPLMWHTRETAPKHAAFPLCVSHKTKQGLMKRELYSIQTWNGVAEWARDNLKQGQRVMLQGYLTQRRITQPDGKIRIEAEVTAEEFFPAFGGMEPRADRQDKQMEEPASCDKAAAV